MKNVKEMERIKEKLEEDISLVFISVVIFV
jgi:hypothetical protein